MFLSQFLIKLLSFDSFFSSSFFSILENSSLCNSSKSFIVFILEKSIFSSVKAQFFFNCSIKTLSETL